MIDIRNIYTVGQLNSYIKGMFEEDYLLRNLAVKGEVSNCKYYPSGHLYFTLKDEKGTISCVMFAGSRAGLCFHMSEGQQVIVCGSVKVYERDGKYQLCAREIQLAGNGQLYERYERLKQELYELGMFSQEYKQPIPKYIRTLGVVSADVSTGAGVRDIIQIARRRNPYVQIILYPAIVQGKAAVPSIVQGIRALEALGVDVMIVGRGGGSIEDLWAFNERAVAQAVFDCAVPIISAVGHETDTTIIDYVADLRAPTPSAAAELAVTDIRAILNAISNYTNVLERRMASQIERKRGQLSRWRLRMRIASPEYQIGQKKMALISAEQSLQNRMDELLAKRGHRLALCAERLQGLSPLERLRGGYSYVRDEEGKNVRSVRQVREGQRLAILVSDGQILADVAACEEGDRK